MEGNDNFVYEGIEYHGRGTRDDPYVGEEDGRIYIDNRTKWLQCKNAWLIVNDVIRVLFMGLPFTSLPESVKKLVDPEMKRRHPPKKA